MSVPDTWWAIVGKHQRRIDRHATITPALYADVLSLRDALNEWLAQMDAAGCPPPESSQG